MTRSQAWSLVLWLSCVVLYSLLGWRAGIAGDEPAAVVAIGGSGVVSLLYLNDTMRWRS